MLAWASLALLLLGVAAFAVDRPLARWTKANIRAPWRRYLARTTDIAKGAHWLIIAVLIYAGAKAWEATGNDATNVSELSRFALALLASVLAATVILHTMKFVVGRRRPRDDFEHNLYGFEFLRFDLQYNSFPSGHSVTIACVATVMTAALPLLAPLWFVLACYFAATRALLSAHFLSDVVLGIALGVFVTRVTFVWFFPDLTPAWF